MRSRYLTALAAAIVLSSGLLVFATPPAGSGSITGKVTYTGTPPKMKPIDMSKDCLLYTSVELRFPAASKKRGLAEVATPVSSSA